MLQTYVISVRMFRLEANVSTQSSQTTVLTALLLSRPTTRNSLSTLL